MISAQQSHTNHQPSTSLPRNTLILALIAGLASLLSADALAQSTLCANLNADLAALGKHSQTYDPYGDALNRQRDAIDRASADYQRNCSTGLFSRPSAECPAMAERINAMQANLQKLEKGANRSAARPVDPARQKLLALLQQNHCNDARPGVTTTNDRPAPGIFSIFSGNRSADPPAAPPNANTFVLQGPNGATLYREDGHGRIISVGPASDGDVKPRQRRPGIISTDDMQSGDESVQPETTDESDGPGFSGKFRTLCVRTCDGFYFPISYSAANNQIANDTNVCHARCPAAETRLFISRNGDEDGEQSVAADGSGERYSKLPNALRYRREVVNGCTCGRPDPSLMPDAALPQDDRALDGSTKIGDVRPELPVPLARPIHGEDPETMTDMEIDFLPHAIEPPKPISEIISPDALRGVAKSKTIRVVGPKFYADR